MPSSSTVPLITIGITCYNARNTIARAVAGAQAQKFDNFEILIVDDCSTDGAVEKIKALAVSDKRIRFFRHDMNRGYPALHKSHLLSLAGFFRRQRMEHAPSPRTHPEHRGPCSHG